MALPQMDFLERMAMQLHCEVRQHGVKDAIRFFNSRVLTVRSEYSQLSYGSDQDPDGRHKLIGMFCAASDKLNLLSSSAIAYMMAAPSLDHLSRDSRFLYKVSLMDISTYARFLQYAVGEGFWKLTSAILDMENKRKPQMKYGSIRKVTMMELVHDSIEKERPQLFSFVVDRNLLLLNEVIQLGPSSRFRDKSALFSVLSLIMKKINSLEPDEDSTALNIILHDAVGAGASTFHASLTLGYGVDNVSSPLELAALKGRLDIVRLLYRTGATTNAELFRDMKISEVERETETSVEKGQSRRGQRTPEIDHYVRQAARNPRKLKHLCMLNVSYLIGCHDTHSRLWDASLLEMQNYPTTLRPGELMGDGDWISKITLADQILFRDAMRDFLGLAGEADMHSVRDRDPPGSGDRDPKLVLSRKIV